MKLTTTELIQRANSGGDPLDNESAHLLGIGHGTPLILMPKRQFVSLLKRAKEAVSREEPDLSFIEDLEALLKQHDQFVIEVSPIELYE